MKKTLLAAFCCFLSALAFGQDSPASTITVKGIAVDSATNAPQGFVTVAVQDAKTKAPVRSNLTKDDGTFELKPPAGGTYQLAVVFMGYQNKLINITGKGPVIDLGKIKLQPSTKQLKEVSVTAVKPLMEQQVDRIAYNVSADPEAKALTALDIMRKVPLLTVDAGDNILLKGSGNYKILINGRESGLLAKNPSDVLRSMPATNIVKIEVITTPPAKYDAEGLAGIINIITTKKVDEGYNIGINLRYNTLWGLGLGLNATVKEGKFGFTIYTGTHKPIRTINPFTNTQDFYSNNSILKETGVPYYNGNYKYVYSEFSYEIDSLDLVTGSISVGGGQYDNGETSLTSTAIANIISQQFYNTNSSVSKFSNVDANINYQLGFKKSKDQLLTLSYQYSYTPDNEYNQNLFTDTINYLQPNYRQYNNSGERDQTIQVDYAQPLKKFSLEAGGKAIFRNAFSDFNVDTLVNGTNTYGQNAAQTNDFNYGQNVYSLYNSYQVKLNDWTGKAGLRLEETDINADFSSVGSSLNTSYANFIPSVSIQRKFKTNSINFGYTERIQRPYITQLNPFVDRSDPQFISAGNPNLKPELSHLFELNYSYFSTVTINTGFSYSFSNNSIQSISSLRTENIDNKPDTVTYTTYENLGSNRTLGYNINAGVPITKMITMHLNGLLNHQWLEGFYNNQLYKNNGYVGNIFTSFDCKFNNDFHAGIYAGFFSGSITLQGKSNDYVYNSFVFSKDFLRKTATIAFTANNPYSKYWNSSTTTNTPQFAEVNNRDQNYRNFAIRLSYRFGRLNSDIKKNQHGINNDDVQGSSKGGGNQ